MYTNSSLIASYLGTEIAPEYGSIVMLAIQAVQNFIENYCGDDILGKRVFEAPDTDEPATRYFDGNGKPKVYIGEATSISSLEVDGIGQVIDRDFYAKPYNARELGRPFEFVELAQPSGIQSSRAKALYDFSADQRNIKVIGKFRYSDTVPSDIQLIATQMAGSIINESISDGIKSETLGDYRVDYAGLAKTAYSLGVESILDQYKRKIPADSAGIRIAS
jgi:hypothetical protein